MRLEIRYDEAHQVYSVRDVGDTQSDEPLGIGTSPDEAVGMAVRAAWLAADGGVTVDDIAHEDDSNIGDDLCDRCRRSGVVCYRTDEHGTVCVDCDNDEEDDG